MPHFSLAACTDYAASGLSGPSQYRCEADVVRLLESKNLSPDALRLVHAMYHYLDNHPGWTPSAMALPPNKLGDRIATALCAELCAATATPGANDNGMLLRGVKDLKDTGLLQHLEIDGRRIRFRFSSTLAKVAKAIDYLLSPNHWSGFTRFLGDGRVCLSNNAAERSLRGVALGRKSWLFAGSERGGQRAAAMYTLIGTAKLNDIDPQAWLADVIARISYTPVSRLPELLPWHWNAAKTEVKAA